MAVDQALAANRRLAILHALEYMNGYKANTQIIQEACGVHGASMSLDMVDQHVHWLGDAGLVTVEKVGQYTIATLTQTGLDVEAGRRTVPGVKRAMPRV
jgi:DNA-binding transcriptional ArsR family regulator